MSLEGSERIFRVGLVNTNAQFVLTGNLWRLWDIQIFNLENFDSNNNIIINNSSYIARNKFKNFIITFSELPAVNSHEILIETKNLFNTNIKTLELAHRESGRLLTRNKLQELQNHMENIEIRLEKIQDLKYQVQEIMISNSEK